MGVSSIEQWFEEQDPGRLRAFIIAQSRLMEMIAKSAPLDVILGELMRMLEQQIDEMLCSVLLLTDDNKHLTVGAAPSLPADYSRAIDGGAIGPYAGSCGTAAFTRRQIVVEDIAHDP